MGSQRVGGLLLLSALAIVPRGGMAGAAEPMAATPGSPAASVTTGPRSIDARLLGVTEAILRFCAQNDPYGAAKVHTRLKHLTQGVSKESLAEARLSREYQSARESELQFAGKVDPRNAKRLCSDSAGHGG